MNLRCFRPDTSYEANDKVSAAYLMTKLKFGQIITFIPGIRYEQFNGDYVGYHRYDIGHSAGLRIKQNEQIIYKDWLPMVHLKVKPVEWFDIRLAATKTLARANYDMLLPSLYVKTVTDGLITMGNPDLRETIAWNYDGYASIYHPKIGLFTAGYFYKELDGVITNVTHFIESDQKADSLGLPVSLDPKWPSYANRRVRRPENIDQSIVKGFEIEYQTNFSYLPWPFKGLVINANYTRIFSETRYGLFETKTKIDVTQRPPKVVTTYITSLRSGRVPGQADQLANISVGYDILGFSARISFSYQGESLASIGTQKEHDLWRSDFTRLSFSLRQKLSKGLSIYVNGVNLTNQNDLTYRALDYPRPSSLNYYGATYDFGMEYRF
jgi:TonB-dependent receptor